MRRYYFFILLPIVLLIGGGVVYHSYDPVSSLPADSSNYQLSKQEYSRLCEGDIILRHGKGMVSDVIVNTLDEQYAISHCGILSRYHDTLYVIHSVSNTLSEVDGMQTQPLSAYVRESRKNSVIVVRYPNTNPRQLARQAQDYLQQGIPFDHSFDLTDTTAFFCTELIQKTIQRCTGNNILAEVDNPLKFKPFWSSPDMTVVLNHQSPSL